MSRFNEFFFTPGEYIGLGDKLIESPPLIHTSLRELAKTGWCLNVYHKYVRGHDHSRLRFHFYDPDQSGNPFLTFRSWRKGMVLHPTTCSNPDETTAENRCILLKILFNEDLRFSLTKQLVFNTVTHQEFVDQQTVVKEVIEYRHETELEFLEKMNEKRLSSLRANSTRKTWDDCSEISNSQERMAS